MNAARAFSDRVPSKEIIRLKAAVPVRTDEEETGPAWFEDFLATDFSEDFLNEYNTDKERLTTTVRNLWELECLVRALDSMETLASLAGIAREYVPNVARGGASYTELTKILLIGEPLCARCCRQLAARSGWLKHSCSPC